MLRHNPLMAVMFLFIAVALPLLAYRRYKRGQVVMPMFYLFGAALNFVLFLQHL